MSNQIASLGSVGSAAAGITISAGTNATPIVITLGAGHFLKENGRIAIAGVTGNTNMNGEFTVTNVGATTATLAGSVGNGTFGGTVRVAQIFNRTPIMRGHSAAMHLGGNMVGTVDFEAYESYADFAAGANTAGAVAPCVAASAGTASAGSVSTPAKTTVNPAANIGYALEIKMPTYMRMVVTAFTSGVIGAFVEA